MISIYTYPSYHKDFCGITDMLRELQKADPMSKLRVAYGTVWNSTKELLDDHRMDNLWDYITSKLVPTTVGGQAWANVLEPGASIECHNHKNERNLLSGVYYMTPSDIVLAGYGTLKLMAGTILLFPPDQDHWVATTRVPRVSIGFNLW